MVGDEGIYVAQAWWIVHYGHLGPYTYWYDHFPLGWAQIGLWQLVVGPIRFFDEAVLSARVFMGIILGGTTTLLYLLTERVTKSKASSLLSAIIFITSALTLTFGRMVLLDNLAIFWLLLSLLVLLREPTKLKNLMISSVCLALAILSKESILFVIPPYLFAVFYYNRKNTHLGYSLLMNYVTLFFILSFFPLLALLKGELFLAPNQVSFFGTLAFQAGRGTGLQFWAAGSNFRQILSVWLSIDPVIICLGFTATALIPLLNISATATFMSAATLFFMLFLIRGGQVYDFYLIPILPLFALNISTVTNYLARKFQIKIIPVLFTVSIIIYVSATELYPFTTSATSTQLSAVQALKNLPKNSVIIADNYAYLDIYLQGKNQIQWYQKIETDQSVQKSIGPITDILVDEQFSRDLDSNLLPLLKNQLSAESAMSQFGEPLIPGENDRPYTKEFLTLYQKDASDKTLQYVRTISTPLTQAELAALKNDPPYGVLVSKSNFVSSGDLQNLVAKLKANLSPQTLILVEQDDTGTNTIPWINTPSRSFYKSPSEATDATATKTEALASLGFTGAIITSSSNIDGYQSSIIAAAKPYLVPLARFTGEIPASTSAIFVTNTADLGKLEKVDYQGKIVMLEN